MNLESPRSNPCPVCKGAGKVVAGYGVICTEIVEKTEKCPACKGNGFPEIKVKDASFLSSYPHDSFFV